MQSLDADPISGEVARLAHELHSGHDLDNLLEHVAGAQVVMLGEATHGTAEFYEWRRVISERLITEHGFGFIAVEGDWPDLAMIDRYVCGVSPEGEDELLEAHQLLSRLDRWPTWMWANQEVARLVGWLRELNQSRTSNQQIRVHGLDIYSLYKSISAVVDYLGSVDGELAAIVRKRYACFEAFRPDEISYARAALRMPPGCEDQAVANLVDLVALRIEEINRGAGGGDGVQLFDAQQNARVVRNADRYYRTMLHGDVRSWNIRDRHMLETLELLLRQGATSNGAVPKRGIVWAHNTHVGDYRATDMAAAGYVNLGGLARQRFGADDVSLVGFGTHHGEVVASTGWDGPMISMVVPPARSGSYEDLFHKARGVVGSDDFYLTFDGAAAVGPLSGVAGHRAIGVVYDPQHEARGNYVPTALTSRYDAFAFIDRTTALHPLPTVVDTGEIPETWPTGV